MRLFYGIFKRCLVANGLSILFLEITLKRKSEHHQEWCKAENQS